MSSRFRRYLLRSLPFLFLVLIVSWLLNRLWGDFSFEYIFWSALLIWSANVGLNWAIRKEPNRRD